MRQGRGIEATEAVFCLYAKKPLHTGVRTGCHYLIGLSVCVRVTLNSSFLLIARAVRGRINTNPVSMEAGEYGLTRGTCFVARRLEVVAVAGLMWISWCVWVGRIFSFSFFFVFSFFCERAPAASTCEATLPHLPLY